MKAHWQYLKYVLRHKWYVFLACVRYGVIWRGIVHDLSKFYPSEWFPYVAYFYGEKVKTGTAKRWDSQQGKHVDIMEPPESVKLAFDIAWNYHQKRNSHHWQYWLLSPDKPRPNFTEQSYDGGASHSTISRVSGMGGNRDVALVFDHSIDWWKPNWEAVKELTRDLYNTPVPLPMPDADRREMLADWIGAGKALGKPNTWEWYRANKDNMFLHPETRAWIEAQLAEMETYHKQVEKFRGVGIIT